MKEKQKNIRNYLLGKLSDPEAEEIDLRILSEPDSESELIFGEDELIEDFLDGFLSEVEKSLFEKNFIVNEERKTRLEEISLLRRYAQRHFKETVNHVEKPPEISTYDRFSNFLNLLSGPRLAGYACIIIVVFGLIIWQMVFKGANPELARLENAAIELNSRDFTNISDFQSNSRLDLFYDTTRSDVPVNNLKFERLSENIFIRLALPSETIQGQRFKITITRNDADSISIEDVRVYQNGVGSDIRLLIPKSFASKGTYRITAVGMPNPENTLTYSFQVD